MIIIKKHYGFGDTIHAITKATGIEKVVKAVAGEDCGCKERKDMKKFTRDLLLLKHKRYRDWETDRKSVV